MSKGAKAMQKLIKNREGNDAYDTDEDKNPYASSVRHFFDRHVKFLSDLFLSAYLQEEEEEEEEPPVHTGPAIQQQPQQVDVRAKSQTPKPGDPAKPQSDVSGSRAASPGRSSTCSRRCRAGRSSSRWRAEARDRAPHRRAARRW